MENKKKAVLFISQYPENVSPGQRFRFELYKQLMEENGFTITTQSFFDDKGYNIIHEPGFIVAKTIAVAKGIYKRFSLLRSINKYDYIFLQREAAPVGPPFFEWLYIKVFKKKLIYDFDDAIWRSQTPSENRLANILKYTSKVKRICKWAYKVSCGNDYLCNYAKNYSNQIVYNPTCVDTENRHNILANHNTERVEIGWTGSFSTLRYLDRIVPVLQQLQEQYDFDIKIICNENPGYDLKNLTYVEWSEDNEVSELATCHIGLMPLLMDEWCEGKCGFKLIQYLALGIPAVSSPVGVNNIIINHGTNGLLCYTDTEWYEAIEMLLLDKELRHKMGLAGREKVVKNYSLRSNSDVFISLFN